MDQPRSHEVEQDLDVDRAIGVEEREAVAHARMEVAGGRRRVSDVQEVVCAATANSTAMTRRASSMLGFGELATLSQRRTQHLVNADLGGMTTRPKLSTDPRRRAVERQGERLAVEVAARRHGTMERLSHWNTVAPGRERKLFLGVSNPAIPYVD